MNKAIFLFDITGLMAKPWADAGYLCYCFDGQHPEGVTKSNHQNILNIGMWFDNDGLYGVNDSDINKIKIITGSDVSFVFGFPECTDLTVAGAKHFKSKEKIDPRFQFKAMQLVFLTKNLGESLDCPWAFENPVGVISSMWRKPDFSFNPCDFGGYLPENDKNPLYPEVYPPRDAYWKKTCIWHGNGFVKPEFKQVGGDGQDLVNGKLQFKNEAYERCRTSFDGFNGKRIDTVTRELKYPLYTEEGFPIKQDNPGWKHCGGKSLRTKNIRSATPRGFAIAVFESLNAEVK